MSYFVVKATLAISLAISKVDLGLDASIAADFIVAIVWGDSNQEATVFAISFGLALYFPNPLSSTKGIFPSS